MPKLYLVRRGLETFIGPMPLTELREHWQKMAFGPQDEVAGHCGRWVAIEHTSQLVKTYPDVARALNGGSSWQGDSGTKRLPTAPEAPDAARQGGRRTLGLALLFLTIAVGAAVAAVYLASGGTAFSGKLAQPREPAFGAKEAEALLAGENAEAFLAAMATHEAEFVARAGRSREEFAELIPVLRAYAFLGSGEIDGISPKLLRGTGATTAPTDCSEKIWRKRWRESAKQWKDLTSGRQLVRTHWARLLLWDPHWIRRRESRGWINPPNYHAACINTAHRALLQIRNERSALPGAEPLSLPEVELEAVQRRLQWLVEMSFMSEPVVAPPAPAAEDFLGALTCIEGATSPAAATECRSRFRSTPAGDARSLDGGASAYLDERVGWTLLRFALRSLGAPNAELSANITARFSRLVAGDSQTRLDYLVELRALQASWQLNVTLPQGEAESGADRHDVKLNR